MANNNGKIKVTQLNYVSNFKCDGSCCLQSCCTVYPIISVSNENVELYKQEAPELMENVTPRDNGYLLLVDDHNHCLFLKNHRCRIQEQYGARFQPDICSSYPRVYTQLGEEIFISSEFACSEMLKSALFTENAFTWREEYLDFVLPNLIIINVLNN